MNNIANSMNYLKSKKEQRKREGQFWAAIIGLLITGLAIIITLGREYLRWL